MATLYYAHDPMCSWCWGFAPTWDMLSTALAEQFPQKLSIQKLLGGLAPDSDQAMPESMQKYLQQTWAAIAQRIPGTRFNFEFWKSCQPRRSTWPACRAVIAARNQGKQYDSLMTREIQRAYYLEARNPSDKQTLVNIAVELGLDQTMFETDLNSTAVRDQHQAEMQQVMQLGIQGFPGLVLEVAHRQIPVSINYERVEPMISIIKQRLESD